MPCALITAFFPFFVSNGVFALIFPLVSNYRCALLTKSFECIQLIILAANSNKTEKTQGYESSWAPKRYASVQLVHEY